MSHMKLCHVQNHCSGYNVVHYGRIFECDQSARIFGIEQENVNSEKLQKNRDFKYNSGRLEC